MPAFSLRRQLAAEFSACPDVSVAACRAGVVAADESADTRNSTFQCIENLASRVAPADGVSRATAIHWET